MKKNNKKEYAVIDDYIVNQDCEQVARLGHCLATLKMPSRHDIDECIASVLPGSTLIGKTGRNLCPEFIKLPGIGNLVIECDEFPISGNYEEGWEVHMYITR
jgi:hypothetical protein